VVLGAEASLDDTELRVPPAFVCWHLDHWLTCARGTLLEMYEALGGPSPWGASSLERARHDQRVRERLVRAFEQGELVALRVEEPVGAWAWPEPEVLRPEPPPPRPVSVPEEEVFPNAALQALTLKRAAQEGAPFCEECERRRRQREAA
jgi:hypothetical protein